MKTFYKLLAVALLTTTTNNFVWFALTYWVYLETKSVISTSTTGGIWLVTAALSSIWFGAVVDRYKKKHAMLGSSVATLILFIIGFIVLKTNPDSVFTSVNSPTLWVFALMLLFGIIAGSIYQIAIPTLVAVIVPKDKRDRANGMFGTVIGISFAITSVASGLVLAYGGMYWILVTAIICTLISIVFLSLITIPDDKVKVAVSPTHSAHQLLQDGHLPRGKQIDFKGTIAAISAVPGLFALIFFTTFNNFLGGVFMALMDAYGLTLVSVKVWGILWGFLSFGFIFGGLYIAKKGLGNSPISTLFKINIVLWIVCIFFTIQASIVLLAIGCLIWMSFVPFIEAIEQTVFQKVVPPERLGRVFGFAHSIEQAASPLTAFFIGPIAQFFFIPFMTTGKGVELIGSWFGSGTGRGIALVFILAGLIGLSVTLVARKSNSYKLLAKRYSSA